MSKPLRRDCIPLTLFAPAFVHYCQALAQASDEGIPFLDTKPPNPERPTLPWEQTTEWLTPKAHRFRVAHYGYPEVDPAGWRLHIRGLVERPLTLSLEDIKRRKAREQIVTIECSGNSPAGGLIYNTKWKGAPLGPLLKECGIKPEAYEAVFFAADSGNEKIRGADYPQHFARSLPLKEALRNDVLLCYEMDGQPLEKPFGAPLRLVVPGWYGVAWVKWLTRIEIHDRAFLSRFMGRDYVTIRGEKQGDQIIWRETSVGRMNLKSVVGRVTRRQDGSLRVMGAAWSDGTPIHRVELKIDEGPWTPVSLHRENSHPYCWTFWSYEWKGASPGEHSLTSRATDTKGRVQPAADDPWITLKKTYWEANQQATRKIKI
ncbi:MAG: sulfite oxidase [Bryobacteraceae bacterium]|nr:sulfite oxidase [Bryobacteraceae bacterium]MDW8379805.1 sulfite oxidase [Bryobacterales bacterium]